jgi:hypothetical protein
MADHVNLLTVIPEEDSMEAILIIYYNLLTFARNTVVNRRLDFTSFPRRLSIVMNRLRNAFLRSYAPTIIHIRANPKNDGLPLWTPPFSDTPRRFSVKKEKSPSVIKNALEVRFHPMITILAHRPV